MEPEDLKHLREAVDVIEERLPGGKVLTRIVLAMLVCMVIVWSFLYLWRNALVPLSRVVMALVTGTTFTVHIGLGDILTGVIVIVVYGFAAALLSRLLRKAGEVLDRTMAFAEQCNKDSEVALEQATEVIKALNLVTVGLEKLDGRVSALERLAAPHATS